MTMSVDFFMIFIHFSLASSDVLNLKAKKIPVHELNIFSKLIRSFAFVFILAVNHHAF